MLKDTIAICKVTVFMRDGLICSLFEVDSSYVQYGAIDVRTIRSYILNRSGGDIAWDADKVFNAVESLLDSPSYKVTSILSASDL